MHAHFQTLKTRFIYFNYVVICLDFDNDKLDQCNSLLSFDLRFSSPLVFLKHFYMSQICQILSENDFNLTGKDLIIIIFFSSKFNH